MEEDLILPGLVGTPKSLTLEWPATGSAPLCCLERKTILGSGYCLLCLQTAEGGRFDAEHANRSPRGAC